MRSALRLLAPLLLLAAIAAPARAVEWTTWNSGVPAAAAGGRPVLVDVYTDWCGWCRRMDRDVYARPEVSAYLASHFVTVRLNAEGGELTTWQGHDQSARALASRLGVRSYPTTIFLAADGTRLVNVPGYLEPDRFLLLLRFVGDGHMERGETWEQYVKQAQAGGR